MNIINTTKICNELIKAIAKDVGLDLSCCNLEINYSTEIKGKVKDDTHGEITACLDEGMLDLYIEVHPTAKTSTLAHELRHGMQYQTIGVDILNEMYEAETEVEGYENNILEVDARDAGNRWSF